MQVDLLSVHMLGLSVRPAYLSRLPAAARSLTGKAAFC